MRRTVAEAEILAGLSRDTLAMVTHTVVGAVVSAARAGTEVTTICDSHVVTVIFFAAIAADHACHACVKVDCDRPVVRTGKTSTGGGYESEAKRITRTGKTSTSDGLGASRDLRVAIWDPARDALGVMTARPAVASQAVNVEDATCAGNDSVMVKDTTAGVKEVLVESHRDRRRQVVGATFLKTFKRPQSGGPLARSMKEITCGR